MEKKHLCNKKTFLSSYFLHLPKFKKKNRNKSDFIKTFSLNGAVKESGSGQCSNLISASLITSGIIFGVDVVI